MTQNNHRRLLLLCSGVGHVNRGFESFAIELAEVFCGTSSWHITLGFGGRSVELNQLLHTRQIHGMGLRVPSRESWICRLLARVIRRSPYFVEQALLTLRALPYLHTFEVVMTSDGTIANILWWLRKRLGFSYRILFSNGAPFSPPYPKADLIHHLSFHSLYQSDQARDTEKNHVRIPYGFKRPPSDCTTSVPATIMSGGGVHTVAFVGAIGDNHKRLSFLLDELKVLERLNLIIIGHPEQGSEKLIQLAQSRFQDRCTVHLSVPQSEIFKLLQGVDLLILPSLYEGFGRVIVEAALVGIPALIHDSELNRELFSDMATLVDLSGEGSLAKAITQQRFSSPRGPQLIEIAESKYSWGALFCKYEGMFTTCSAIDISHGRKQV